MVRIKKKRCRNCKRLYIPDPRNAKRQKYCSKPECRKASKAESQSRWLDKPENEDYFRSTENVQRVQQWRKDNPGYSARKADTDETTLQDPLTRKPSDNKDDKHAKCYK